MNVRLLQLVRISAPIAAALLVTANHGQAAGVTSFDVPSGGAVYEQVTLGKTEMKDLKGQTMYSYPLALKRTGGALPKIKVKVALPKGKTLKSVGALIVNIPPGGSAPILAQSTSASFGIGSSAIQAAPKKDWAYLSSLGLAVAEHVRKLNPKVKIIFAGFSAGGFAAELATYADVTRVSGLIQIGSFPMSGNDALPQSCPSVILVGQSDSNLDQATVAHQVQAARGAKIELLTHAGGHSWGSQADQALAIRALVRMRSGKAPEGLRISPELTSRLLALSAGDSVRELGPPVTSDYALVRKPGEAFDWRKALTTREIVRDFPSASLAIGTWILKGSPLPGVYFSLSFGPSGNRLIYQTEPEAPSRNSLIQALQLPPVTKEVELTGQTKPWKEWSLEFGASFPNHVVTARETGYDTQLEFSPRGQQAEAQPLENSVRVVVHPNAKFPVKDIFITYPPSMTVTSILSDLELREESVTLARGRKGNGYLLEAWNATPKKSVPRLLKIEFEKFARYWWVTLRTPYP